MIGKYFTYRAGDTKNLRFLKSPEILFVILSTIIMMNLGVGVCWRVSEMGSAGPGTGMRSLLELSDTCSGHENSSSRTLSSPRPPSTSTPILVIHWELKQIKTRAAKIPLKRELVFPCNLNLKILLKFFICLTFTMQQCCDLWLVVVVIFLDVRG